jgi:hypothetical protein
MRSVLRPRGSNPHEFRTRGQVGQESNLQPAVLETERFSLSCTTCYGLRTRFNRGGVAQQNSGQISGQTHIPQPRARTFRNILLPRQIQAISGLAATSRGPDLTKEDCYTENLFSREPRRIDGIAYAISRCR